MAPGVKKEILSSCTVEEFLSEKLKRYIKEMTRLEKSNLYDTVIGEVEKALIKIVVNATDGNQLRAAKALGISRNTLREKMRQYRLGDYQSKTIKQKKK
ncbi:MAG: helix-turn-helix domain-containing protein [Thermodesulfovibrionales bacterium]